MIKITTICGSLRSENATNKALRLVHNALSEDPKVELTVIDPVDYHLTLPGQRNEGDDYQRIDNAIGQADGVILATPEYHGSYSSVIKAIIDNLGYPSTLSGKPVALLGVASGQIGAIKALEHLRSVCSHVGSIVLPGPISIPKVNTCFDDQGNCLDPKVEQNIRGLAKGLVDYISTHVCPGDALEHMVRETS